MSTQPRTDVPWWRNHPWLGSHPVRREPQPVPVENLLKYENKHLAWIPDGSGIRDADEDMAVLWKRIESSGDDPSWFCSEYIAKSDSTGGGEQTG